MTAIAGTGIAQKRLNTTVRPGKSKFEAIGHVPRGTTTPGGGRAVPPLQPNSSLPHLVQGGSSAPVSVDRIRNIQSVNKAARTAPSGTVRAPLLMVNGMTNSALAPAGIVGGIGQDAHAIPMSLHGTPLRAKK